MTLTSILLILFCVTMTAVNAQTTPDAVRYRDFGAVGDGKTDDFPAIQRAHEYANQHNLPVRAEDDACYYLRKSEPAIIMTDTDWGKAQFIIDDRGEDFEDLMRPIFVVQSALPKYKPEGITSLKRGQTKLPIELPCDSLVLIRNNNVRRFIRYGVNANDGSGQQDILVVKKDGTINPRTQVAWDFDEITSVDAFPIDETTLTIRGGILTTLENTRKDKHRWMSRNLMIKRSNVVIEGLQHKVIANGTKDGWPYVGFLFLSECAFVTARNCTFSGHVTHYWTWNDQPVPSGSYDLGAGSAACISYIDCKQFEDINDRKYWGIFGSNFCKDILFERCSFSRFDAHQGTTNATLRDCEFGYMGIMTIGFGTFLAERTTVYRWCLIDLRQDYGSSWDGDVIIRDCRLVPQEGTEKAWVIYGVNGEDHDFGFPCQMPANIIIDGLTVDTSKMKNPKLYLLPDFKSKFAAGSNPPFPYQPPKQITLKNLSFTGECQLLTAPKPEYFKSTIINGL